MFCSRDYQLTSRCNFYNSLEHTDNLRALNASIISTTLNALTINMTFGCAGNLYHTRTTHSFKTCTTSTHLKLMLYEGNDFPSYYSTHQIKVKLEQHLPYKSLNCIWNLIGHGTSIYVQNGIPLDSLEHSRFDGVQQ